MGDAEESRRMENLSLQANRFPRDLLQRFMGGGGGGSSSRQSELVVVKEENSGDEIELNLGLSLGGRFGVDKSSSKLVRSSSIAGPIPIVRDGEALTPAAAAAAYPTLARTSSLPVETEDEWRKRKEMQTLRRMEAKRRRSEKQRNLRSEKDGSGGCSGSDERREIEANLRGRNEREQYIAAMNRVGSSVMPQFKLPRWPDAVARQASLGGGGRGGRGGGGSGNLQGFVQTTSQGSIESQGGSSSSVSELDTKPLQGSSSGGEVSPASIHSLQEQSNQNAGGSSGSLTAGSSGSLTGAEMESPSRSSDVAKNRGKETGMNSLGDMPCVFTKGDGPNGKRIEGILYKYGKGEEVRIMCVCHGNFYSPAGFVKHAGGREVAQPLKHIVINPKASSSF